MFRSRILEPGTDISTKARNWDMIRGRPDKRSLNGSSQDHVADEVSGAFVEGYGGSRLPAFRL